MYGGTGRDGINVVENEYCSFVARYALLWIRNMLDGRWQ